MATFDLQELLSGNRRAAESFVLEYSPMFCKIVQNILGGPTWGNRQEDLVQDIFLALFEDEKTPCKALRAWRADGGSTLRTFLWRFAQFRSYDRLRNRGFGNKNTQLVPPDELGRLANTTPESMLSSDSRQDCAALIQVACQVLSDIDQRFFEEAFINDCAVSEMAQRWETTEGAIHQRRTRVCRAVVQAFYQATLEQK